MEWFAVLIPVATAAVLLFKYQRKVLWWEFAILLGVPTLLIGVSKAVVESCQTRDTEYWGGLVTKAEYYEEWDERVSCRHPKYRTVTSTDSKGNTHTEEVFDGYHHPYDVDYHPSYWQVIETNGLTVGVDKGRFEALSARFKNRVFADLRRSYHSIDGDKYEAKWDRSRETAESTTAEHTYENRVQASDSVFNFQEVDPKTYGLYEYPPIYDFYRQHSILGPGGPTMPKGEEALQYWNGILGPSKQARIFFLVYKNKPMQAAIEQRNYWKGGNKNEFIVCIGVDDQFKPQWCFPFSWTEAEISKIEARNAVMDQKELDFPSLAEKISGIVQEKFVRKRFRDFNYLTVEPPMWAVILIYVLTFGSSVGIAVWAVMNEFDMDDTNRRGLGMNRFFLRRRS